jgi:hypothetical protein
MEGHPSNGSLKEGKKMKWILASIATLMIFLPSFSHAFKISFFCSALDISCKAPQGCCPKEYANAKRYTEEMNLKYKCEASFKEELQTQEKETAIALAGERTRTITSPKCSLLNRRVKQNCPAGTSAKNFLDQYKICVADPSSAPTALENVDAAK